MKTNPSLLASIATAIALCAAAPAFGESADEVIDTLHQAETSTAPLPLLQKAKEQLQHFNPKVHTAGGARAHNPAANRAEKEHKEVALKKLQEAIDQATAGQSPVEKIHAAIAEIHLSDQDKH